MKLGTVSDGAKTRAFSQSAGETRYYNFADVGELIAQENWQSLAAELGAEPEAAQLVKPILRPGKIICAGLNYHDHAREVGKVAPEFPTLFSKVATSINDPYAVIELPALSKEIDWEAELVIVIGSRVKNADLATAQQAILGYTIINDVSARDWQRRTSEWFQGKNFDGLAPIGPVIVTADELDIAAGLKVETIVNGKVEQSGTTAELIFSPAELIVYISQFLTLEPGDLIATGTPAGVGFVRKPAEFLKDGDRLVTRIEGIGELSNELKVVG